MSSSNYTFDHTQQNANWGYPANNLSGSPTSAYQNPQGAYGNQGFQNDNSLQGLRGFGATVPAQNQPASNFDRGNNVNTEYNPNTPKPMVVGPGRTVTFDELIKNKTPAFFYFAKLPETMGQFAQTDMNEMQRMFSNYNKTVSTIYFATCFLAFFGDRMLRQKNMIYGMTYRTSIFKFLCKFWILPTAMTTLANKVYLENAYKTPMDRIAGQYNFNENIFREAFEKAQAQAKVAQNPNFSNGQNQQQQQQQQLQPQPQANQNTNNVRML